MSDLLELLEKIYNHYCQTTDFLASSWLFVRLAPVCLVVESTIAYMVTKYSGVNQSKKEIEKEVSSVWKFFLAKLFFLIMELLVIFSEPEKTGPRWELYMMVFYYIYTLVMVVLFISYFVSGNLKFNKPGISEEEANDKDA